MSRECHIPSHLFTLGVSLLPEDFPIRLIALKGITGLTWEGMSVCLGVDPRQLKYWRDGGWPNGGALLALVRLSTRLPMPLSCLWSHDTADYTLTWLGSPSRRTSRSLSISRSPLRPTTHVS